MSDIVEKLFDLHKQATKERSHYYVGSLVRDAIDEIMKLRKQLEADVVIPASDLEEAIRCVEYVVNERLTNLLIAKIDGDAMEELLIRLRAALAEAKKGGGG